MPISIEQPDLVKGDRIRVLQRIVGRDVAWQCRAEGVVESCRPEPTGSWFAHGKNDRLWLLRIRLRKDDGEITTLVVDEHTRIEKLNRP